MRPRPLAGSLLLATALLTATASPAVAQDASITLNSVTAQGSPTTTAVMNVTYTCTDTQLARVVGTLWFSWGAPNGGTDEVMCDGRRHNENLTINATFTTFQRGDQVDASATFAGIMPPFNDEDSRSLTIR
ncbi:hypothetical protein ABT158_39490 [Nonomuraea sp. NPDC001636]|uniref:hypothetical protein n=1 Tax=Nonomuraea sp. NPDC001636 TaxID=3154391 RepID=UPI003325CA69